MNRITGPIAQAKALENTAAPAPEPKAKPKAPRNKAITKTPQDKAQT